MFFADCQTRPTIFLHVVASWRRKVTSSTFPIGAWVPKRMDWGVIHPGAGLSNGQVVGSTYFER
jgi:hypothetical protein